MPHEIGEMFYCGDIPWHRLGRRLPRPATLDEALKAGGLDWEVELVPLVTAEAKPSAVRRRSPSRARTAAQATRDGCSASSTRSSSRCRIGRSGPVPQPARPGRASLPYRRLPARRRGRVAAGEAARRDRRDRGRPAGDVPPVFNSHDGSQAIDIRLTTVRVVCRNTLSLALGRNAIHAPFRRAHRHTPRILQREAEAFFASVRQRIDETKALFRRLHAAPCDDVAFARFLWQLLPDPRPPLGAPVGGPLPGARDACRQPHADARRDRRCPSQWRSRQGRAAGPGDVVGFGQCGHRVGDHAQDVDGDRYAHALFGSGDRIKSRALALAMAVVLPD